MGGVGVAHSGGIIGRESLAMRNVSPNLFRGAPKFHGGGLIGKQLTRGERPIIAMDGEGVFTKEQMSALSPNAGSNQQSFSISAPITIHGSSGTPEQNSDLAAKMGKQLENTMRELAQTEIRKATRPGNSLNRSR